MKEGVEVTSALSLDEINELQALEKIWSERAGARDAKKKEKKNKKEKLDAYRLARKRDPNSIHNKFEDNLTTKNMDRGKAFGGKYDGKVARKVMENPAGIYDEELRTVVKNGK